MEAIAMIIGVVGALLFLGIIHFILKWKAKVKDSGPSTLSDEDRPVNWATKLDPPVDGLNNAFWVEKDVLMRSAQPEDHSLESLKSLGIKTIVNLRTTIGDYSAVQPKFLSEFAHIPKPILFEDEVVYPVEDIDFPVSKVFEQKENNIKLIRMYFIPYFPSERQVIEFLQIVTKKENQPVLVHCRHGSDRTGTMCASYKICVQGWDKEAAITEMERGGYGFHYRYFQCLIGFLRNMNIDRIKKDASTLADD